MSEWKLAPVEATREMVEAGMKRAHGRFDPWVYQGIYEAMLAAAPSPPQLCGGKDE